jgi:hypothetical protein
MQDDQEEAGGLPHGGGQGRPRTGIRRSVYRRNLLFVLTLVTLFTVFLGAVPLADDLAARPEIFAVFWAGCFLLAAFILGLACYDLARVREDHRRRSRELEKELARVAAEAREAARLLREEEAEGGEGPQG